MKYAVRLCLAALAVLAVLQFVRPRIPQGPATAEIQAPTAVKAILSEKCYSCHSNERRLAWFDEIQPGYWLVRQDVLEARERLNFSTIGSQPAAQQKAALYEAVTMIQLGAMPLPRFLALHPDAKVSPDDLAVLKAYLSPWSTEDGGRSATAASGTKGGPDPVSPTQEFISLSKAPLEYNGLGMSTGIGDWKLISITDRGDNNTLRLVVGNDLAMQAIQAGKVLPWPDGAQIAKIAFQKERNAEGLIVPGQFVQIELMAKDAQRYGATSGWGWGRWRGPTLKPYGESVAYLRECTGCHEPVKGNDNVYTLPISQARVVQAETINNAAAALPRSVPYQPLAWTPVTMFVNPRNQTMSALFSNDVAQGALRAQLQGTKRISEYRLPSGSVLALITWRQRDDPHWFGARIPSDVASVEFLVAGPEQSVSYSCHPNDSSNVDCGTRTSSDDRKRVLLSLVPAQYPH